MLPATGETIVTGETGGATAEVGEAAGVTREVGGNATGEAQPTRIRTSGSADSARRM